MSHTTYHSIALEAFRNASGDRLSSISTPAYTVSSSTGKITVSPSMVPTILHLPCEGLPMMEVPLGMSEYDLGVVVRFKKTGTSDTITPTVSIVRKHIPVGALDPFSAYALDSEEEITTTESDIRVGGYTVPTLDGDSGSFLLVQVNGMVLTIPANPSDTVEILGAYLTIETPDA